MGTTRELNIGHNLDISIWQLANGNSCWGHVILKNDLPLEFNCTKVRVIKIYSTSTRQLTSHTYLERTTRNQLLDLNLIFKKDNNRIEVSMLQSQLNPLMANEDWFCTS